MEKWFLLGGVVVSLFSNVHAEEQATALQIAPTNQALSTVLSPEAKTQATKELLHVLSGSEIMSSSSYINRIKKLINEGADVNAEDEEGLTPLQMAVIRLNGPHATRSFPYRGDPEVAKFLVENGADMTARAPGGATILHLAADAHNAEMAQFLIEKGADINATDNEGKTPLQYVKKLSGFSKEPNKKLIDILTKKT